MAVWAVVRRVARDIFIVASWLISLFLYLFICLFVNYDFGMKYLRLDSSEMVCYWVLFFLGQVVW